MPSAFPQRRVQAISCDAFFTDDEFEQNKRAIDLAFATLTEAVTDSTHSIVIPSDGLGTGRAELDKRAPMTFAYLEKRLDELESPE